MIQFNLLPDIKLEYIKAKQTKRLVMLGAFIVAGASLAILILLFLVVVVYQKQHMDNLSQDIKSNTQKLANTTDLNKILTIQNQLNSLTALHDKKPVTSRVFGYIVKVTPNDVSIQKLDIDFTQHTMSISGNADSLSTINKFVDTLKFTTYTTDTNSTPAPAFSKVVLSSFSLNQSEKDPKKAASYQISLSFDPVIFDSTKNVTLTVPKIVSTRSETEKPNALFNSSSSTQPGKQN